MRTRYLVRILLRLGDNAALPFSVAAYAGPGPPALDPRKLPLSNRAF